MKCPHCGKETEMEYEDYDLEKGFAAFVASYPNRRGGQRWPEAKRSFKRLMRQGREPEALVEKAKDYKAFCMLGNVAPQYVMQAATFLGGGGGWQEDWCKNAKPFSPFDQARRQLQETS